ncbi:hypothetical protein FHT21_002016 [Pedobacter sp. SG908]|nr:hypothetical protein [Pedobacter sp. SG908]
MPIKSLLKKLNFVKNLDKIERFVAVFAKEFINQKDKKIKTVLPNLSDFKNLIGLVV